MKKSLLIAAMFGMSVAASAQQTFTHITGQRIFPVGNTVC